MTPEDEIAAKLLKEFRADLRASPLTPVERIMILVFTRWLLEGYEIVPK